MVMRAAFMAAFADVWPAITAILLFSFVNLHPASAGCTTATSAQTAAFVGELQTFFTLAAAGVLYTGVALIYRHLHQAEAAAAGNRRLSDLVTFVLFAAAGFLVFSLFVQSAGAADDDAARELGLAALSALPAAATATFFWGVMLLFVFVAHIRAGGEGGGGIIAAGDLQIQGALSLLTKAAIAAAAALSVLMAMAINGS